MIEKTVESESNGLAIVSFVLALVWVLFLLLPFISVICWILALIFGIVALCKKQKKWAWLTGCIISWFFLILTTIGAIFVVKHSDELINPIIEHSSWLQKNPDIVSLMQDDDFNEKLENLLMDRLEWKYGEDLDNVEDLDDAFSMLWDVFEEMRNAATELSNSYLVDSSN